MTISRKLSIAGLLAVAAFAVGYGAAVFAGSAPGDTTQLDEVRARTLEYHRYEKQIQLTREQQAVFERALSGLPAPCCSDRSALTCCCTCNMARSWWGLAKHLIAERGQEAEEVRAAVAEWIDLIHPDGYAGDACYRGRCGRPFRHDGCGGMTEGEVVF